MGIRTEVQNGGMTGSISFRSEGRLTRFMVVEEGKFILDPHHLRRAVEVFTGTVVINGEEKNKDSDPCIIEAGEDLVVATKATASIVIYYDQG